MYPWQPTLKSFLLEYNIIMSYMSYMYFYIWLRSSLFKCHLIGFKDKICRVVGFFACRSLTFPTLICHILKHLKIFIIVIVVPFRKLKYIMLFGKFPLFNPKSKNVMHCHCLLNTLEIVFTILTNIQRCLNVQ